MVIPENEVAVRQPGSIQIEEEVSIKQPSACCTTQWEQGMLTGVQSQNSVSVDGTPRHILDVRQVNDSSDNDVSTARQGDSDTDDPVRGS